MKFKKILATVGSVLMLSSVIGGAFAAGLPTTLKADNTVIVQGTGSNDANAISTLQTELAKSATQGAVSVSGESFQIKAPGTDLTYDDALKSVRDKLTSSNLPSVLAKGKIRSGSSTVDYTQELNLGSHAVAFGDLEDEENYVINSNLAEDVRPVLYLNQGVGEAWNLVVKFDQPFNATGVRDGEKLVIAGKEFTVAKDLTTNLILYASAQTEVIGVDSTKTVNVGGESYVIEVQGANTDQNEATISINGKTFQVKAGDTEYVDDQKFYVNRIFMQTVPTPTASVEIFVGAEELDLGTVNNGFDTVKLNDEDVDGMEVSINAATDLTKINSLTFAFTPSGLDLETDEANYLEMGESISDPIFGTINLVFGGSSMDLKDSEKEVVSFTRTGQTLSVELTNRDGNKYTIKPIKDNKGGSLDWDSIYRGLDNTSIAKNDIVLVQEGLTEKSYITRVLKASYSTNGDEITFKDESTGDTTKRKSGDQLLTSDAIVCQVSIVENGGNSSEWTVSTGSDWYLVNKSSGDCNSGTVTKTNFFYSIDSFYTENNAKVTLDYASSNPTSITVREQYDKAIDFTIDLIADSSTSSKGEFKISLDQTNLHGGSDDEGDNAYYLSEFGTYAESDTDKDAKTTLYIPSEEVTYDVTIASEVSSTPAEAGKLIVADTDAAKMSGKNLIVVGGSAINSVAADYLGFNGPTFGEAFTEKTGVSAGEYLIQSFDKDDGKVAIVVAGYNAADTENGAKYLALKDYVVGKKYKGTTADVAQEVTA